jgi:hypothetical protein
MQKQDLINRMIELSEKKLNKLLELKKLSERQKEAFELQQLDEVEKILNKKDEIISSIGKLDDAFLTASDALKKILGINSLTQLDKTDIDGSGKLKDLIEKITALVEEIISIEKLGYENAVKVQGEFSREIKNINAGKKITNAYNTKPLNTPSYFFDKKMKWTIILGMKKTILKEITLVIAETVIPRRTFKPGSEKQN